MRSIYRRELGTILFIIILLVFLVFNRYEIIGINNKKEDKIVINYVEKLIQNNTNYTLISQNDFDTFSNVFMQNNDRYISFYINTTNGKTMQFDDLLKKKKINNFYDKVYELLALKYPSFIVDGIKNGEGEKVVEVKENEMIMYFYDYTFNPNYTENITLHVNYNEVKDYLNFKYKLDNEYYNESGYDYDKNKKTVALTLDDGPSPNLTPRVVQALSNNKMHATFFMVGINVRAYPQTVQLVYNSGNEIGSHSLKHANLGKMKMDAINSDLATANSYFNEVTNDNFKLLRPPYGSMHSEMVNSLEMPLILWSLDPLDWKYRDCDTVVNNIMSVVKDGDIILVHDIHETSVQAVEKILPMLYAEGYQVVSVSELAALKGATLQPHVKYRSITNESNN
ncbi:MAG: polysaccharide deacetylase family protein [Bacilli bacterium]|nr:polysaccharide deacetylase family protein [Bacilli bacterium]